MIDGLSAFFVFRSAAFRIEVEGDDTAGRALFCEAKNSYPDISYQSSYMVILSESPHLIGDCFFSFVLSSRSPTLQKDRHLTMVMRWGLRI